MRLSHPYVWVFLVVGCALGIVFIGVMKLLRFRRAFTWNRERAKRDGWPEATAHVESWTRITEGGMFRLVLRIPPSDPNATYRTTVAPSRVRGIARLPDAAVGWLERGEIPVRIPRGRAERLTIDLKSMLDDAAEREAFVEWGATKWNLLP